MRTVEEYETRRLDCLTIDKFIAREIVRHTMMYLERKYPYLDLQKLHTHDPGWQISVTEASFWTAFYDDIVKNLPYVEGTEHKFDNPETVFEMNTVGKRLIGAAREASIIARGEKKPNASD